MIPPQPVQNQAATAGLPGIVPPTGGHDPRNRLGDVIIELGFADRELIEEVMTREAESKRPMGELLVRSGLVTSTQLAQALAERNSLDFVDLNVFNVDQGATNLVSSADAQRYQAVPIAFLPDGSLLVATADPSNVLALDDIAMSTGYPVRRAIASPEGLEAVMKQLSVLSESVSEIEDASLEEEPVEQVLDLRTSAGEAPVIKLAHSSRRRGRGSSSPEPANRGCTTASSAD
jgi:type IV pilus assembly protein PilB